MGVDVGLLLHVVVRAPRDPVTGERRMLFAGEFGSFDEIGRLIRRFHVRTCVIDALPETRKARELQAGCRPGVVWLAYYDGGDGAKRDELASWHDERGDLTADRTRSLDETVTRFVEGTNTLPAGMRQVVDYYPQMTAIIRVTERRRDGNLVARWVQSGPDHYAHAENYCTLASLRPMVFGVMAQGTARRRPP